MQYLRKINNVNPAAGRYLSISIPAELSNIFKTDMAIVEALADGKGIVIRPARVEAI
jgi:hypothetical protein